jgi:hypothetical protein
MTSELRDTVIQSWILRPSPQKVEETASLSHETRRIPDPYIFLIKNHKIVSPSNGVPVQKAVTRNNSTEEAEFNALLKIQDWADREKDGMVLWFSPPGPYQDLKIIASEITYQLGQKVLFNRGIDFSVSRKTSLEIANKYTVSKFNNPEELRSTPIFLGSQNTENWAEPLVPYTNQIRYIKTGKDLEIKVDTLEKAVGITSRSQAESAGLIGPHPDSCSSFNKLFSNAEKSFPCPRCHKAIPSGRGMTKCPYCGVTKEQYGAVCD